MASYPFVAAPDHWPRGGVPVRAIAIHHAEGGGTVSWLTRNDGNSSHYVVERSGRVVQMVREDRAAGSINPNLVRVDDDKPFTFMGEVITYGVTANKAALGEHWRNPNAAVIAIEVEGFAADGPNSAQRVALGHLVADIRSRHDVSVLGHRDWQSYKACPGRKIPWADYGGHGKRSSAPPVPEADDMLKATPIGTTYAYIVRAAEEAPTYGPGEGERGSVGAGFVGNALGVYGIDGLDGKRAYLLANREFVLEESVSATKNERDTQPEPTPAPVTYAVTVGGKAAGTVELP
jgi:hypothetical protein